MSSTSQEGSAARPLSRMRRAIVRSMTASSAVPQITLEADANLRAVAQYRESLRAQGITFSYSDIVTAACAHALVEHPVINSSYQDDAIVHWDHVHVGIAIALDDGLIAPAVMDTDQLRLNEIADERRRLTAAARSGQLSPAEALSATFTVSNLGAYGVRRFRALVVPPQAGIMAVGALTPSFDMSLSVSLDHRVVDGAPGALFLRKVVDFIQSPEWVRGLM